MLRTALPLAALLLALPPTAAAQSPAPEPLPLELAVSLRDHNGRSPIGLSPDGAWVAHTIETADRVERDGGSGRFSATGFPFAEGDARMEATLSHAHTGETVRLGGAESSSWAPVWSPDGRRVAFYSDEGGSAGLWIWEAASRTRRRLPGLVVRPIFGFETVRWTADGRRLLVRVLPEGMSVAEANARVPARRRPAAPEPAPDAPAVTVRRAGPTPPPAAEAPPTDSAGTPRRVVGDVRWAEADLALVDAETGAARRLVEEAAVRAYALSPDQRHLAYTVLRGGEENSQQAVYDLVVLELASGARRTLGSNLRMTYGIEWSWAPDGRSIAMVSSGQLAAGELVLHDLAGGQARVLGEPSLPSFDPGDGEYPPLWSADSRHLYALGADGALWRVEAASGRGEPVGRIPGWRVESPVWRHGEPTLWTTGGGRTAWVVAREEGGALSGIHTVDLETGAVRPVLREPKSYRGVFSLTASDATGEIAFVSTGQHHLQEVWLLDTATGRARQASRINDEMSRYPLGTARVIRWRTPEGDSLAGSLLLPPGHRAGARHPLVVWAYGGATGSGAVNRFALTGAGAAFNMQLLATRGYAVLYPDVPVREGDAADDIVRAVTSGVDAAIAQGFADPDRLAVMGQSYGSYSTLVLITRTDRFRAAIVTAAVLHPDLFADYLRAVGYYERGQGNMGGTIWEHHDRYLRNSPLFHFPRIRTPLLIGQGDRDGNLVPAEAIFSALERLGKEVEYRLYAGEGHVITRPANVLDFWRRRLDFLAEHLDLRVDAAGAVTTPPR